MKITKLIKENKQFLAKNGGKLQKIEENHFLGQAQPGPVGGPWATDDVENYNTFETEKALDRLNTFVQSMNFGEYLDPYAAVNQLFKRLHTSGLYFNPTDIKFVGKSGKVNVPVSRMGGVMGPDLQGNYAPSHGFARVPEGLSLQINYEKQSGRTYITAEIVHGTPVKIEESSSVFEYVHDLKDNCKIGLMRDEMSKHVVIETWCEDQRKPYREIPYNDDIEKAVQEAKLAIDKILESEILSESIFSIFDKYPMHFDSKGAKVKFDGDVAAALIKNYTRIDKSDKNFIISIISGVKAYETVREWVSKNKPKGSFTIAIFDKALKNTRNVELKDWSEVADYLDGHPNPTAPYLVHAGKALKVA